MDETRSARELLRHTLATLAYRAEKVLRDPPEGFAAVGAGAGTRTAGEILAHMGDLLDWAAGLAEGRHAWSPAPPTTFAADTARFFAAAERLDAILAGDVALGGALERIFQGPLADALTHVGQIALLRRLAGASVRAENYYKAEIAAGRLAPDPRARRLEFD